MPPFHRSSEASMSLQPSEPPSSPLVSNSFLYNLPDPTLGMPTTSAAGRLDFLPSPFKRSTITPLNKPLSHEQTRQLSSHKASAARSSLHLSSSSPRKALSPASTTRLQANLDTPGGLPTPPSSSEALTTTPRSSTLAQLPREPVSPSPSRTRNAVLSPARASPSKATRTASTPRQTQRTPTSRSLRADNGGDSDDDDDLLRSTGSRTPTRMHSLREVDEGSDLDQDHDDEDEEEEEEEEIKLISFKRGGPDATFIREIKENGWDQPMPPSPIKFTYLEPVAPRPRQSSVASRARSQSRSKTPQTRASPAPSHASASRASSRALSVRAPSAAAVDQADDLSNESIKSSGSALTHISRASQARSNRSLSSRKSVARASVAPPVVTADLTRDHPSLPDSPGDDPLLLTGPDTYIVYHNQTPSAKNRSTSRVSKTASAQPDASLSMHVHSTPLPVAAAAADAAAISLSQRRESSSSASSSASRSSLYTRMSGHQADDASAADSADEEDRDESQRTEHANAADISVGQDDLQQQEDQGAVFLPFDDAGFASDSDQDEPAFVAAAHSPLSTPVQEASQSVEDAAEGPGFEDISSMSDVSRSFVDGPAGHDRVEISGPVDVSAVDDSRDNDDSAIIEQSLHVSAADLSMDASEHDASKHQSLVDRQVDQTMDTSGADHSTDVSEAISEDVDASSQLADASVADSATDGIDESADVSTIDQSIIVHAIDGSMDVSVNDKSMDASINDASVALDNSDQSGDVSASGESQDASSSQHDDADASVAHSNAQQADADQTNEEVEASDESGAQMVAETSVVADYTLESQLDSSSSSLTSLHHGQKASEDTREVNESRDSDEAASVEHDLSTEAVDRHVAMADASLVEQSDAGDEEESVMEHSASQTAGSINLDFSLTTGEQSRSAITSPIDGALLPHPVVLLETLPEDSSAIMAWKARKENFNSSPSLAVAVDFDDSVAASIINKEDGDFSTADASVSIANHDAGEAEDAGEESREESHGMSRSESVLSSLSAISERDEKDEEAFRQKYQSSHDTVIDRSTTMARRLSLSSDSEQEGDVAEQPSKSHEQHDAGDEEDLQDADQSSARRETLQASRAHSHVDEQDEELEDDDDEEEEEEEVDDESALSDDDASSGEEQDDEEEQDEEEEEEGEEEGEASRAEDDASSQLGEDEQSDSALDPVVIISSSASPSDASRSSMQTEDLDSEDEDGEEEYVVSVVRDSRDRSFRPSEHSFIDDEPEIHTLHLRQPAPRHASFADDSRHSHTAGDASHSRSRVLKLGQATSTPIVEISSLDPRAAARATAILKLFHKYVDEGWISGAEMGDATEGRMRKVVDAIQRADRRGARLEDASELQQLSLAASENPAAADLTTLLMDAELSLAREGTVDSESFLASRATSVASQQQQLTMASPATPFLPGGFRATPRSAHATAARTAQSNADESASPSTTAVSRLTVGGHSGDSLSTSNTAELKRKQPAPSQSFTFPGLSTPDRTLSTSSRRAPAKQARLSAALAPPSLATFNPRVWDTKDWVRLDKYFTSGVKQISSRLLASSSDRSAKANSYADALLGVNIEQVSELFLDEMHIPQDRRSSEWTAGKVEHRLLALQRKYLRKVEAKYPNVLAQQERSGHEGEESMATEDLDWSLTTAAAAEDAEQARRGGRVSFGTPYRNGAHSTPAVGLLKKATSRAAKERAAQETQQQQPLYPPLPTSTANETEAAEGVITKASRLISRLSGNFGGLLSSPRPSESRTDGAAEKGKRKATEAELEPSPAATRRRVDDSLQSSEADSTVDSLLDAGMGGGRVTSTINSSMFTNATTMLPDASSASQRKTRPVHAHPTASLAATITAAANPARPATAGRPALTSSLQLAGGSSGVSHTPLSLLSPATHRVAARKVDELRQSRAERNWTSPQRQRLLAQSVASAGSSGRSRGSGRVAKVAAQVGDASSGRGRDSRRRSSSGESSLAEIMTSQAGREAVDKARSRQVRRR